MGVRPDDEVFKIYGDVRFAGSVTGAVRWRQGYLSLCQDSNSATAWLCFVYYEARDKLPASNYKLSQRTLNSVPKNPERAEKSGFIQFIMYNGSNIWIKRNSRSQMGTFYRFAEILCGIKNGTFKSTNTKEPLLRQHIDSCLNYENVIPSKMYSDLSASDLSYEEKTPPKRIIRRHTLSSQKMLQKSISRRRLLSSDYSENDQIVVVNGSYSVGSSPLRRSNDLDDRYKRSDVLDSGYKTPTKTSPDTSLQEQYSVSRVSTDTSVVALFRDGEETIGSNKENCIVKRNSLSSRKNIALRFLREGQLKSHAILEGDNTKPTVSPPKIETVNMLTSTERFYSKDHEIHVKSDTTVAENSQNACQFAPISKSPPKRSPLSEISPSAKRWKRSQSPVDRTMHNSNNEESVCDKGNTHVAGFTNIGNSCYMNSVLQALFAIRCFTDDLLEAKLFDDELHESALCRHLVSLLRAKLEGTSKHYHLENVKEAVVSVAPWFGGTDQHDAHEFLGQVLDQLKEEVNRLVSEINESEENDRGTLINPVQQNFEFEMINSYMCQGCREVVGRKETFLMLSLDLPGSSGCHLTESVQDALDGYFKPEKLQFFCEKCHAKDACCVQTFTKLPRVMVLHLKRYNFSQLSVKVAQPVVIPTVLSLHKHIQESTLPPQPVSRDRSSLNLLFSIQITNDDNSPPEMPENATSGPDKQTVSVLDKDEEELSAEDIEKMSDHDRLLLAIERSKRDSLHSEYKDVLSSPVSVGLKGGRKEGPLSILPPPTEPDSGSLSDCPTEKYDNDDDYDGKVEIKENSETDKDQVQAALQMSLLDVRRQEEIELRKALQISMQELTTPGDCTECINLHKKIGEETSIPSVLEVDDLPYSYHLTGIVSHIGQTAQSGHYLCDVYDILEDTWWHVNDDVVQKKQKEEVLTERMTSAYLLFYVAKEALPSKASES